MFKFFFFIFFIYGYFIVNGIHYGKIISSGLSDSTIILVITKNNDEVGYCGGNLLSNKLVVTAAHCVYGIKNNKQIYIIKGYQKFSYSKRKYNVRDSLKILWIKIHPSYQSNSISASYDIALLGIDKITNCCSNNLGSPNIASLPFNLLDGKNMINENLNNCFIVGRGENEKGFLSHHLKGIIYKKPLTYKYKNNKTDFIGYYDNLALQKEKFANGDSGYGLYCKSNNKIYLIGIASACYYSKNEKIIDINTFSITLSKVIKNFLLNIIKEEKNINNINKINEECSKNNNTMDGILNHLLI